MKKSVPVLRYGLGVFLFFAGALLSVRGQEIPALLCFTGLSVLEMILSYRERPSILDFRFLLSLSWLLGIALSCLKLSDLQTDWSPVMWICLGGFYFVFLLAFETADRKFLLSMDRKTKGREAQDPKIRSLHLFSAILIVSVLGLSGFLLECIRFRFQVPLLVRNTPHAYTEFHISGVHYFVVSLMFVHPLTVIYLMEKKEGNRHLLFLILLNLLCLLVPVLLLSKLQVLIALVMPVTAWMLLQKRIPGKVLAAVFLLGGVLVLGAFVLIVRGRDYPEGYLQAIFAFRDADTPLWVQYSFMYLTIHFENLNTLISCRSYLTWGTRELYPFFCLTNLKSIPEIQVLIYREVYLRSYDLTTRTILYDVYGDFGALGCVIFGGLFGVLTAWTRFLSEVRKNIAGILLYGQLVIYTGLSFFTTWFSVPTTWFWFIATAGIAVFTSRKTGWLSLFRKKDPDGQKM